MTKEEQKILVGWAKLFEPLHQSILKTGNASCCEYDQIWHDYKTKIRSIIKQEIMKMSEEDFYQIQKDLEGIIFVPLDEEEVEKIIQSCRV